MDLEKTGKFRKKFLAFSSKPATFFLMTQHQYKEGDNIKFSTDNAQGEGVIIGALPGTPILGHLYVVKVTKSNIDEEIYPYSCILVYENNISNMEDMKEKESEVSNDSLDNIDKFFFRCIMSIGLVSVLFWFVMALISLF